MAPRLKYRFMDKRESAEVSFQAFGNNLEEVFANSATALVDCMVDLSSVNQRLAKTIKLQNQDINSLLIDFLNEVIYYRNSENMLLKKFDVEITEDKNMKVHKVTAKIAGEPIYSQHILRCDVKTTRSAKVEKKGKTYEAEVILSI